MIVGGYSLDLYCDNEETKNHPYNYFPHQYAGNTRGECFRDARKDGWILNYYKNKAICPLCSGKKIQK